MARKKNVTAARNFSNANTATCVTQEVVEDFLRRDIFETIEHYKEDERSAARRRTVDKIVGEIMRQYELHDAQVTSKTRKFNSMKKVPDACIADIVIYMEHARRLGSSPKVGTRDAPLAIYDPEEGIYNYDAKDIKAIIADYLPTSSHDVDSVYNLCFQRAPKTYVNQDPELIAFKNGVLDRRDRKMMPHSPDLPFVAHLQVDYNPHAENVVLQDDDGEDWDVETWMRGLSDDASVVNLLWEVVAASMRPNVDWNRTPWLYSTAGANGKGTLCEMIRSIVGHQNCASLAVADFAQDFMVQQLLNTTCCVADENPVGTIIDKVSTFKAAVTGDVFTVNRKYLDPVSMTYNGVIIQCMNSLPQAKDRTGSFYRRQIFIPMEKSFADVDKPEIKDKLVTDPRVLEYVARRCIEMDFDQFSEPVHCDEALNEYKMYNDVTREFIYDVMPVLDETEWDFVPYQIVYDLYASWANVNYRDQKRIGRRQFLMDFQNSIKEYHGWTVLPNSNRTLVRKYHLDEKPNRLLYDYNLDRWQTRSSSATTPEALSYVDARSLPTRCSGIVRNPDDPHLDDGYVVDVDPDDVEYVGKKFKKTAPDKLRDYKWPDEGCVADAVAEQLDAEPDFGKPVYDASAEDLLTTDDIVQATPEQTLKYQEALNTLLQLLPTVGTQQGAAALFAQLGKPSA